MKRCRRTHDHRSWPALLCVIGVGIGIAPTHAQPRQRVNGETRQGLHLRTSRVTGLVSFVTSNDGGAISVQPSPGATRVTPMDFLVQHGQLLGITDPVLQLRLQKNHTDALFQTHYTYQQFYKGVEVFSGVIKVHQNQQNEIIAANGDFYRIKENIDVVPTVTIDRAVASALKQIKRGQPKLQRHRLVVVNPGWYGNPSTGAHLAYYMILSDKLAGLREGFFIDAHSGEVLDQWNMIHTLLYREVYDGENRSDLPGTLIRAEGDGPHEIKFEVNHAYDYLGDVYGYFFRAFGWDSLDNNGLPLIATVNSRATGCPNAFWSDSDLQAGFCKLTVSDDIVAHEMMHGIIDFTANLFFRNQAGQLNESYADIFGELVDLYNGNAAFIDQVGRPWPPHATGPGVDEPNSRSDGCNEGDQYPDGVRWMIGEDASALQGAIRDMWNPTCLGHPDRATSPLQHCSALDNGGVHTGNGIPNHAFAMLTDGKAFNGYTVEGIGPIKSAAVWFRALTTYLTIAADFQDAYDALNRSATDLIGTHLLDPRTGLPFFDMFTEHDALQVDLALRAVELNTSGGCGHTINVLNENTPPECPDKTILFADDFENGAPGWSVSNTQPFTPYDWELTTSPLPFQRAGVAWFVADADIGDCVKQDETALHSLFSPEIAIPEFVEHPALSFTHYIALELGWDGGMVRYRKKNRWNMIPLSHFRFNPFNAMIRPEFFGNTNPFAGKSGWSGVGGQWGTTVIDLTGLIEAGDTTQLRFDLGKDFCVGLVGWYVDDVELYDCNDCDQNNQADSHDLTFTDSSDIILGIGLDPPLSYTLENPPLAVGDVEITFSVTVDLAFAEEFITVLINGQEIGNFFEVGAEDCPHTPDVATLILPAEQYNAFALQGFVTITMISSAEVDPNLCRDSGFIKIFTRYDIVDVDINRNHVLDECEPCSFIEAPAQEPQPVAKNRYLSFIPDPSNLYSAVKIILTDAPEGMEDRIGQFEWVNYSVENQSEFQKGFEGILTSLSCKPILIHSRKLDMTHVFSEFIIPGATYTLETVPMRCLPSITASIVNPYITINTARWGDVVGATLDDPPDGIVDQLDIMAVVNFFEGHVDAATITRADLHPATPDQVIDIVDILQVVDAYLGLDYPFAIPSPCE